VHANLLQLLLGDLMSIAEDRRGKYSRPEVKEIFALRNKALASCSAATAAAKTNRADHLLLADRAEILHVLLADLFSITIGRRYSALVVEEIFVVYSEYKKALTEAEAGIKAERLKRRNAK
jgi:hypothetical protein